MTLVSILITYFCSVEFEIDIGKMPLGKLSKAQINKAYRLLTSLQTLVERSAAQDSGPVATLILGCYHFTHYFFSGGVGDLLLTFYALL